MTYIDGADFFVRLVDFPDCAVGGFVTTNDDGTYSVYINSRLSQSRQVEAYLHEREHIEGNDLYNDKPIEDIEDI